MTWLDNGADRKRLPVCRTTRDFVTTRRERERRDRESAAPRQRPKRERCAPSVPRPKLSPTCPAFLAARMTSPMNVSGLRLLRPRSRMRPSLMRRSSSRRLTDVPQCARMAMALSVLKCLAFRLEAPAGWCDEMAKYPNPTNHLRPAEGGAFPLPSCGRAPSAPMPHRKICELMRHPAKCRHSHHGGRRSVDLGTNRPSVCGVTFGGRAFGASNFCASAARGSLAEPLVDGLSNCCGFTRKKALHPPPP